VLSSVDEYEFTWTDADIVDEQHFHRRLLLVVRFERVLQAIRDARSSTKEQP
jgi:hypothetical protein